MVYIIIKVKYNHNILDREVQMNDRRPRLFLPPHFAQIEVNVSGLPECHRYVNCVYGKQGNLHVEIITPKIIMAVAYCGHQQAQSLGGWQMPTLKKKV